MFFPQCSTPWSCCVSETSTLPCRRCSTWSQIRIKTSMEMSRILIQNLLVHIFCHQHSLTCTFFPRLVLPSSSPRWQKNQIDIKMYLSGVVQACWLFWRESFSSCLAWNTSIMFHLHKQLLSCLTESTVISAVLRHANQLVPYYLCLPKQCRLLLKVKHMFQYRAAKWRLFIQSIQFGMLSVFLIFFVSNSNCWSSGARGRKQAEFSPFWPSTKSADTSRKPILTLFSRWARCRPMNGTELCQHTWGQGQTELWPVLCRNKF